MSSLRALLFYAGLALATLIVVPTCFLILPLPYPRRFRIVGNWARFNLWWLGRCCGLHAEIRGAERIPAAPFIILCKHQSAWETMMLQLVFPAQVWVLKRELLWIPIYGWGLATMEPIAINRGSAASALRQLLAQGRERLRRGLCVVIYPEGTRTRPGERRKYHGGGGLLACDTGLPVSPVAHNAGCFWPRRGFAKRPGTIRLVVGPLIYPAGKTPAQVTAEAEAWIESTVAALPRPRHR